MIETEGFGTFLSTVFRRLLLLALFFCPDAFAIYYAILSSKGESFA